MDVSELVEMIKRSCASLPAFHSAEIDKERDHVEVEYEDLRPGQAAASIFVEVNMDFRHPLFDTARPCLEFLAGGMRFDPNSPSYASDVAFFSLPWVDHIRLVPGGPIVKWSPREGIFAHYGQVRLEGKEAEAVEREVGEMIRDMIALNYLVKFKNSEMKLIGELGEEAATPVLSQFHSRMMSLLGLDEGGEDSID